MADYFSVTRTSRFRVTDEDKFRQLLKKLISWGPLGDEVFVSETKEGGDTYFVLCTEGDFEYEVDPDNDDWDIEVFYKELQEIIHPDDVYIEWSQGNEKFRYFGASAVIITKDRIEYLNFSDTIGNAVRELTGNKDFSLNDVM